MEPTIKQLAQVRPSGTSAVSAFKKFAKTKVVVSSVTIANTTASAATYSLYMDKDGTTYDQTTALFYGINIDANNTVLIEYADGLPVDLTTSGSGNFAVQSNTANALTFTVLGSEIK